MRRFNSPEITKNVSAQDDSNVAQVNGVRRTEPFRLIPEHARLLTYGIYRNHYYYRTDRGVPVYDARNVWLCDTAGNLRLFSPRRGAGCRRYTENPTIFSGDFNPYVPLMVSPRVISTTISSHTTTTTTTGVSAGHDANKSNSNHSPNSNDDVRYRNIQITTGKLVFCFKNRCHTFLLQPFFHLPVFSACFLYTFLTQIFSRAEFYCTIGRWNHPECDTIMHLIHLHHYY